MENSGERVQNPKVSIASTISKIETMADKSLKLQIYTQELNPEQKAAVFEMHDKMGYFFFDEAPILQIDKSELPEIEVDESDKKTPSERLRDRMFIYFREVLNGKKEEFEVWRRAELERIGQKYLDKVHT